MENRLFGVTLKDLRSLAFELADKNNLPNNFNRDTKLAGKAWLYDFLEKNPELRLRQPEATSLARAMGFNRVSVGSFFDLLTAEYDKHKFTPDRIWNVDETGVSTVPNKKSKVLALRGKKQVGALTSAERGTLVTAEVCMSASGMFMPLMFVFPRKTAKDALLDHSPPGSIAAYHESGWMQKHIFIAWFRKFIEIANPSEDRPVLLLLDGHATHTKSVELIDLARQHHVVLLCFPPHCTHRMQPLDVALMAPLSTYYSQEVAKWQQHHPGRPVTIYQVAELFGSAFLKAASMQTAINGFRKTGIYPLDRNIFPDHAFQPSQTTERVVGLQDDGSPQQHVPSTSFAITEAQKNDESVLHVPNLSSQSSSSPLNERCGSSASPPPRDSQNASSSFSISPSDVMKLPHAERKVTTNSRRGKTAVLTSSPYKAELISSQEKNPKLKSQKRKGTLQVSPPPMQRLRLTKIPQQKPAAHKKHENKNLSDSEEDDPDVACLFCDDLFSNSASNESWIMCVSCKQWAHEECTGKEDCTQFICDICK